MFQRRELLNLPVAGAVASQLPLASVAAPVIKRPIPSSGELLPVIGMGSSRTFDVGNNERDLATLTQVMEAFATGHGTLVDSSPMYGNAEPVLGQVYRRMKDSSGLFSATKVWITGRDAGPMSPTSGNKATAAKYCTG